MRRLGVACGLITGAALLGPVPVAIADVPVSAMSSDSQAPPQAELSMLAVALTVGGAFATAGSGLALTRRRALSQSPPQHCSQTISPDIAFLDHKIAYLAGRIRNVQMFDRPISRELGIDCEIVCADHSIGERHSAAGEQKQS